MRRPYTKQINGLEYLIQKEADPRFVADLMQALQNLGLNMQHNLTVANRVFNAMNTNASLWNITLIVEKT